MRGRKKNNKGRGNRFNVEIESEGGLGKIRLQNQVVVLEAGANKRVSE